MSEEKSSSEHFTAVLSILLQGTLTKALNVCTATLDAFFTSYYSVSALKVCRVVCCIQTEQSERNRFQ